MKSKSVTFLLASFFTTGVFAQDSPIFPKGELAPNVNHVGNVWLHELVKADAILDVHASVATFDPGARLNWHKHPGGQILFITEGVGYYQEKGQAKKILRKGDVIKCPPNLPHWHGASADTFFVQVAISGREKGEAVWLEPVTDEEYNK